MTKTNNVHVLTVDIFISKFDKPSMTSVFRFKTIESLQKVSEKLHKDLDSESIVLTIGPDDFGKCESLDNEHIVKVVTSVQQDVEEIVEDAAFKKILERIEEVKRMLANKEIEYRPSPWIVPCVPPTTVYYGIGMGVSAYATPDICSGDNNWTWTTGDIKIVSTNVDVNDATSTTTYSFTSPNKKK